MSLTPVETPDPQIVVLDNVVGNAEAYRADALQLPYQSHTLGAATFHGIALATDWLPSWIAASFPMCRPTLSFFRRSPFRQAEPNFVHSDLSMGDWTAILYLNPDPPAGDGTTFWQHRDSGARFTNPESLEAYAAEGVPLADVTLWRPWYRVPARFNRLVLFPAPYYHSRSLPENYGHGDDARLVQVTFGGYVDVCGS